MSTTSGKTRAKQKTQARGVVAATRSRRSSAPWVIAAVIVAAVVALLVTYRSATPGAGTKAPASGGHDSYSVGAPGVGATAPDFALPDVTGHPTGAPTIRLADYRGKSVLLYFHEGLGCQPCWNQIRDLQNKPELLKSLGVDQLLTITTGPADLVAEKMADDKLTVPALVDPDLTVSRQYQANQYGMMGTDRDGHTFILVGPDGRIQWRADYGGTPNYTMYVAPDQLAGDLRAGRVSS
jgi:peroxiredoxin